MPLSKRTEEEYFNIFGKKHHTICEGLKCQCHKEVLQFLHQSQVDAIKEFVEGLVPENKYHVCSNCSYGSVYQECSCFYKACKEIQERINNKLKEI